jgi:hypothetical protein
MRWFKCTTGLSAVLVILCATGPTIAHDSSRLPAIARDTRLVDILIRDGGHEHHSHHHGVPKLELNETEIEMWDGPTPSSYYTIDWEEPDSNTHHPGLMVTHALLMSLAFFGALPIGIALRSVKHPAHTIAALAFYGLCALGCASSALYTKLTPNIPRLSN